MSIDPLTQYFDEIGLPRELEDIIRGYTSLFPPSTYQNFILYSKYSDIKHIEAIMSYTFGIDIFTLPIVNFSDYMINIDNYILENIEIFKEIASHITCKIDKRKNKIYDYTERNPLFPKTIEKFSRSIFHLNPYLPFYVHEGDAVREFIYTNRDIILNL